MTGAQGEVRSSFGGNRPRICVIDGQRGGISVALIKRLKQEYGEDYEIIALGTNAVATAQMMKARVRNELRILYPPPALLQN